MSTIDPSKRIDSFHWKQVGYDEMAGNWKVEMIKILNTDFRRALTAI
jgi:hypothetical protein